MPDTFETRLLCHGEEAALAALETAAWPGPLQASLETIRQRMQRGHRAMVAERDGTLIASACYIPTAENPFEEASFPRTFESFSSLRRSEPVQAVYVYNLCVHPRERDGTVVRTVMRKGIEDSLALGARYLVADGRCPSYAGAVEEPDTVVADEEFRKAIDEWRSSGEKPSDRKLLRDPVLRFYRRLLNCQFLYLLPDFIPGDAAAGGHRVIFVSDLTELSL
jgi:hypothetical protein